MTDATTHTTQAAGNALRQAQALARLMALAEEHGELAQALANIDTQDMEQRLTLDGLRAEYVAAHRDASYYSASAETSRRIEEANGQRVCACAHTATRHAKELTDDMRLPCAAEGCRCADLRLAATAGR
ncbi:hypothetical protein RCO28_20685 [Streptomyces sp. LHD-70]|uniref:hypothetical protein n=1 Tax=Streptomyces sp. LHD-70 TaxID=3072140 RepID=UPI00280E85B7|nr:hypothetical protein [Streptomyces sp. LHD-70]MDQ8704890.1 hypothetical protein [Streptomyces sp. LHD-70]